MKIIDNKNPVTRVSLITNTDGIHTELDIIQYVTEDPIVVLTKLIGSHFVSQYNKKTLYPMSGVSFDYSLAIDYIGDYYDPATVKPSNILLSIDDLIKFNRDMINKALFKYEDNELNDMTEDHQVSIRTAITEYFEVLSKIKDDNSDIQFAIDFYDVLNGILCKEEEYDADYISRINHYINRNMLLDGNYTIKLIQYMYRTSYTRIL